MKTSATNRKVGKLLTDIRNHNLIPRPEFQRRLVWTNKDKQNFLQTVLQQYPFPEIYVATSDVDLETGEGTEMLVDGQQRLTTLNQYFTDSQELKLSDTVPAYSKLDKSQKIDFLEYEVVVRDLGRLSIEEIKEVFKRLNSTGYSLNAMEIQNSRFNGEFKQFGETIASNEFFERHRVFNASDIRRMDDTRFVLSFIITIMSTYFTRANELEDYLSTYNDKFEAKKQLCEAIDCVFDFVESLGFDQTSRVWKKADIFTLLVETHRAIIKDKLILKTRKVAGSLDSFYKKVDIFGSSGTGDKNVGTYHKAALQATNDRQNRIDRGNIIKDVIRESP